MTWLTTSFTETPALKILSLARRCDMGIVYMPKKVEHMVAPSNEKAISALPVGSLVKMKLSGKVWEWLIVQQGRPSSLYDASCDGTWCLLNDCYEKRAWGSTNNDYANSDINVYLNGPWFNLLAPGIQKQVKQVKIPYRPGAGNNKTPINSGAKGLSVKAFLLSAPEIGFTTANTDDYAPMDGARLAYFPDGSDPDPKRVAKLDGSTVDWSLRSPSCSTFEGGEDICLVADKYGTWVAGIYYISDGTRPCIILPKTALVDKNGNVLEAK